MKDVLFRGKKKDSSRVKGIARQWKSEKRAEALERQKLYNSRAIEQKLSNPKIGKKETAKLLKKLNELKKENNVKSKSKDN